MVLLGIFIKRNTLDVQIQISQILARCRWVIFKKAKSMAFKCCKLE